MQKKNKCTFDVVILSFFFVYCVFISLNRLIARDEGFYIVASELILHGKILYKDFFFPQMPFTALFFAMCMKIFGISWYVARASCGLIYFFTGLTLYFYIKSKINLKFAIFSLIVISLSPMAFPWFPILKSYSFVNLLLLIIFILIEWLGKRINSLSKINIYISLFFIGFCFGMLGLVRLYFLGLFPIVVYHLYQIKRINLKNYIYFFIGSIIALIPAIFFFIIDYKDFIFNNFGYHLVRAQEPIESELKTKIFSLLKVLGLNYSFYLSQIQMMIIYLFPILWGILYFIKTYNDKIKYFPILYILWIIFLNSLPSPTYLQYHCCIVIFMTIVTCDFINSIRWEKLQSFVFYFFLAIFIFFYPRFFTSYILTGDAVIGISGQQAENWHLNNIEEVSSHLNTINKITKNNGFTLALWPGHTLGKTYLLLPGTENPFSSKIPEDAAIKYNLLKKEDILDNIAKNTVTTVVYSDNLNRLELKIFLINHDFILRSRIGDTYIWSKNE